LTNNLSFQDVDINAGSLASGQSVSIGPMGTSGNLRYVFPGAFEIKGGASLSIADNASVLIKNLQTITVDAQGSLTVGAATVAIEDVNYGAAEGITVSGTLTATGTTFNRLNSSNGSDTSQFLVNSGGTLVFSDCSFSWDKLSLNSGSTDNIGFVNFAGQLAINSGAALSISGNDFSKVGANGIVASGVASTTINLANNYWGTTDPVAIGGLILDHNDDATRPTVSFQPVPSTRPTQTLAAAAGAPFSTSQQTVSLTAKVFSPSGTVNEGQVTFTILNGATPIGTAASASVATGTATVNYILPANTPVGNYTIQAVFNGTSNYLTSTDTSQLLSVRVSSTTTQPTSVSAAFAATDRTVVFTGSITSAGGQVNGGTFTFTIAGIGSATSSTVSNGSATANFLIPGGLAAGTYTINTAYSGSPIFPASSDATGKLTITPAGTTTSATNSSAGFSATAQTVSLTGSVTSSAGPVNGGTFTFNVAGLGAAVSTTVTAGTASGSITIPAGAVAGSYVVTTSYSGATNFAASSDNTGALIIGSTATTTDHTNASSTFNASNLTVTLTGAVHAASGPVNGGTILFTISGVGFVTSGTVANGAASANFTIPGGTAAGSYTITTSYNGTSNFAASSNNAGSLTIGAANTAVAATKATATFNNSNQTLTLAGSISSAGGPVTGGTFTFTVAGIGAVSSGTVSNGAASASLTIPGGAVSGSYAITTAYSGSTNFAASGDNTGSLTIAQATTSTAPTNEVGSSSPTDQTVTLVGSVNTANGFVNGGTISFTIAGLGSVSSATVSNGAASASFTIPGGTAAGSYTITTSYSGSTNFAASSDATGQLTIKQGSLPDLVVANVTGPTSGFNSQNVLLTWTDKNQGAAAATGPWVDNVYAASDALGHNLTLLASFTFDGTLAAGASVDRTQQIGLPQTAGTYWFAVTTNATQVVLESGNFANNTAIAPSPITISPVPLPDLVVTRITPPTNSIFSGTSVPISFIVTNQGTAPTSVSIWHDWVILSQDPTLGQTYQGQLNATGPGGDQILNNQPIVVGIANASYLNVGDSYQQNLNVKLPIDAQGTWYVYVIPDGTGAHHPFAMPELSRTDKLKISSSFIITLSPPPDLAVTSIKAPDQSFSGQPIALSWTVTNQGAGPTIADTWTDAVYMSSNPVLDSSATLLGTFTHKGALAAAATYTDNESPTLPAGVSGQFYFLVKVDTGGLVFENGALANNIGATAVKTVNLTPTPDLAVNSVTAPTTASAAHAMTFSFQVKNIGANFTPNSSWLDSFYLSPTATFDSSTAIFLGSQTHNGGLAVDGSYDDSTSLVLPASVSGSFFVLVVTDSGNVVLETSKTNNLGASSNPVQIAPLAADLVVSSATAPTSALAGAAILVNWTVLNQGTTDTAVSAWNDNVYVEAGSTLDQNGLLLGSFTHRGILNGGASYSQSQQVTIPISLSGNYNLFVVANANGAVHESNANNNTFGPMALDVTSQSSGGGGGGGQQAPISDLQVTAVTGPATASTGDSITINWTVQNNGPGSTNSNLWYDDVWMSTKTTLASGGTDVYLGFVQHTNVLAASGSYSASGAFTLPMSMAAGNYYFIVATDRPLAPPGHSQGVNLVYETSEANNEAFATPAATISTGAPADLAVSAVNAPASATGGQPLTIGWTVINNGSATGNRPITDSVYLSYDQVFDKTDKYLGSAVQQGGLAGSASYTQNATFRLPAGLAGTFYVFVNTNSNSRVFESNTGNNVAISTQSIQISLLPPVDLVAGTVTIPASAFSGQNITITYQVSNHSSNPANGTWYDSLYLSPTPNWSVDDPLLGKVTQNQHLAAGGSYSGTLTAPVPGVVPGSYYVIVRSNILNTIPETTLSNNLSASLLQSALDAPNLTLGTPVQGTIVQGQSLYYKVQVPAGETLEVDLQGADQNAANELYVSFGTMPSRSKSDYRFATPFQAHQQILVPSTKAGAYYILVYADSLPGSNEAYTLTASLVPFSVLSIDQTSVGNTGNVTIGLRGSKLDSATAITLTGPNNTVLNAKSVYVIDGTNFYATFNANAAPTGAYSLTAKDSGGDVSTLTNVLQIVPGTLPQIEVNVVTPSGVRAGGIFDAEVIYKNASNIDDVPPILLVDSNQTGLLGLSADGLAPGELDLLGRSPLGPGGILRPGESVTVTVFVKALADVGAQVTLKTTTIASSLTPVDPNAIAAAAGLPETPFAGESSYLANIVQIAGSTNAQFLTTLQETVSNLNGKQGNDLGAMPFRNAWNDELAMDAVLWSAQNPPGGNPPPPTFVLPAGQDVSIQTFQSGDAGAPVYYVTAGFLAAESYGPNGWALSEMVQGLLSWTAMANSGGVRPTIKLVLWNSGDGAGLAAQVATGQASGGLLGAYLAGIDYYEKAAARVPRVAQAIANDILNANFDPANVTLIGHSLGAQASILAGFDYQQATGKQLGAIEALDPAGPGYPVAGLYADATAAKIVNTYNTSPVLGEYQEMIGAPGHNYFPDMPVTPMLPTDQDGYAHTFYAQQLASCNLNPAPHAEQPLVDSLVPQLAGGFVSIATTPLIAPHDPNTIVGPKGSGDQHYVPTTLPMPYEVQFQNQATASSPAQQVEVTQQLDATLDWQSFRLGSFGFDGMTFNVPGSTAFYQTTIDLTATRGYLIEVTATIDVKSGIAKWLFATLDPSTGEQPLDPTIGFLPPNDASGDGEGFVNYTVFPKESANTGDIVNALATVTFDTQPPLDTNAILNTLDAGADLTSTVAALPAFEPVSSFNVSWSGSDKSNGSAISAYTIYVSDNGGPFTPWLENTTLTTAEFQGQNGHGYDFFSIAIDNAGNVQAPPGSAQASTLVGATAATITSADHTTFTVGAAGSFTLTATGFPNPVLSETGALPDGVTFDANTGKLSGTPSAGTSGVYALTFSASNGVGTAATQSFTLTVNQASAITSQNSTSFTVGTQGTFTVKATGSPSPVLAESGALPGGVSFDASTGILSGVPSASGIFVLTFTATNGVGATATQNFTLTVNQSPAFTSANQASFTVGSAGTFTVAATGFPKPNLSLTGSLPAGVTFNAATGVLGGTPAAGASGAFNLTIRASNGIGADATQNFTLTVNNAGQAPTFTSANSATFVAAAPGAFTVTVSGSPKPALGESGALPAGVTFDVATGSLSGTPAVGAKGTYVLTLTASNGVGPGATQTFTLTVTASPQSPNQLYVEAVYSDLLGRAPDASGLAFWSGQLDAGAARSTLINLIDHSAEYFGTIIKPAYLQFLGRNADSGGIAYWVNQMINGLSDEHLEAGFIGSSEFFNHSGGTNKGWVDAMYQDLLGRQPDPSGEAFWTGQLAAGADRSSVAYGFAASKEREGQHVQADYQKYLGRSAGQSEIDYWVDQFANHGKTNEDVVTGFVGSAEYYKKHTGT
jgi:hypothetical protein